MSNLSRRAFLQMCLPVVLAACTSPGQEGAPAAQTSPPPTTEPPARPASSPTSPAPTQAPPTPIAQALPPTPACGGDDDPTPAQTEGPYFTPNSPERTSLLEAGMSGTRMLLTGYVLTTGCQPVARALLDFWHADDAGVYDNVGYKLRGHQFTDDTGRFTLETIVPGLYPGRTRHFHVKVQAPGQPILTTQLYFPGEPANARDGIFSPELVMDVQDSADGKTGAFNFVLALG